MYVFALISLLDGLFCWTSIGQIRVEEVCFFFLYSPHLYYSFIHIGLIGVWLSCRGQGLGKNEDGIAKPISVEMKKDSTGVRAHSYCFLNYG
jgi:hypothetical protein